MATPVSVGVSVLSEDDLVHIGLELLQEADVVELVFLSELHVDVFQLLLFEHFWEGFVHDLDLAGLRQDVSVIEICVLELVRHTDFVIDDTFSHLSQQFVDALLEVGVFPHPWLGPVHYV